MNRHPDFKNPDNIGMEVVRHDRYAVARRSVLARGDLFRIVIRVDSHRRAAGAPGAPGRPNGNSGILRAELRRYFATLPVLTA